MRRPPSQVTQIAGSLLVALAIAAVAVAVVTAHFGPTANAKLEAREDLIDTRIDAREERRKEREDRREEAEKRREDG
jgi:F0F1-type ATP synthase membrane subunit b/b'